MTAAKTGRAYDRRFRRFWRQFEGQSIGEWFVHSVNRRLGPKVQPDLVLVNHSNKQIVIHDLTSRANPNHLARGETYVKYFRRSFPDYRVTYTESYWSGMENSWEALSSHGDFYLPGVTKP